MNVSSWEAIVEVQFVLRIFQQTGNLRGDDCGDEELRPIGVLSGVGHA